MPVESLEAIVTKMVQKGAITARINKRQGTVDFIESGGDDNENSLVSNQNFEMIKKIEAQNARIVKLLKGVQDANEKIKQSDDYTTAKARKSVSGAAGGDEEMEDMD